MSKVNVNFSLEKKYFADIPHQEDEANNINYRLFDDPTQKGSLDTLELTADFASNKPGTKDIPNLLKRAKSKYFTDGYLLHLLNIDSPLKKEYWDTWHCNSSLRFDGNTYFGTYCKKRWCIVCARIMTAKRIKTYLPILKDEFEEPYFVTLTQPNIKSENLRCEISKITKSFRNILENNRKNYGLKIKGTRNLEITYNSKRDDYHPHLHCIIDGKTEASFFKDNWLKQFPEANIKGQHIRPFGKEANDILEAFKYSQKIMTQSDGKKFIYVNAMDIINVATKGGKGGVRLFQTFGFIQPKDETELTPEEETGIRELTDDNDIQMVLYQYNKEIFDWIDHETGEVLTHYQPSKIMDDIRNNKIIF